MNSKKKKKREKKEILSIILSASANFKDWKEKSIALKKKRRRKKEGGNKIKFIEQNEYVRYGSILFAYHIVIAKKASNYSRSPSKSIRSPPLPPPPGYYHGEKHFINGRRAESNSIRSGSREDRANRPIGCQTFPLSYGGTTSSSSPYSLCRRR